MHYRVVIFGVKDTTAEIVRFVQEKLCPVDLVVTIHPDVLSGNQVSGYEGLSWLEDKYGIPVYETHSYGLKDEETTKIFRGKYLRAGDFHGLAEIASRLCAFQIFGGCIRIPRELCISALWAGTLAA